MSEYTTATASMAHLGINAAVENGLPGQYLTFLLNDEQYATGILHIKEIIEYAAMARVPMMPECVRGVINLRGAVVPVIDLSARFGRGAAAIGKRTAIIIVEVPAEAGEGSNGSNGSNSSNSSNSSNNSGGGGGRQVLGMMVDAVNAVAEIGAADIEPAPSFGTRIRPDFIAGIGKCHGKFVTVLAIARVLSVAEVVELSRQGHGAGDYGGNGGSGTSSGALLPA